MKVCNHCKNEYSGRGKKFCGKVCQFAARRTGRDVGAAVQRWRISLKTRAVALLGGKCKACGYDRCSRALEFHHLDPSEKEFSIGHRGNIRSWERVVVELAKCVLLCANCHREVHEGLIQV